MINNILFWRGLKERNLLCSTKFKLFTLGQSILRTAGIATIVILTSKIETQLSQL